MTSRVDLPVLVTGGAGFIGANLCRALVNRGAPEVIVLDNLATGFRSNLTGVPVRFVEGSILDRELLDEVTPRGGAVVHLAARPSVPRSVVDPVASHDMNATGTLYVLEAARRAGAAHVVVASSSSVYGDSEAAVKHEELPTAPRSPYAASKLATEAYTLAYRRTYGLSTLAFRFFNVFGPLQAAGHAYAAVIPAFLDAAMKGEPLVVHGDGLQSRDFTYVDTVTDAIARSIAGRIGYDGPVNLAFGGSATLIELIELIESIVGRPLERTHVEPRTGDVRRSCASPDRLRSLIADVDVVEFGDGVKRTAGWFSTGPVQSN